MLRNASLDVLPFKVLGYVIQWLGSSERGPLNVIGLNPHLNGLDFCQSIIVFFLNVKLMILNFLNIFVFIIFMFDAQHYIVVTKC